MNVYDSARMADVLAPMDYATVDTPDDADLIILNTCHIREKAAEKVYSELGRLNKLKDINEVLEFLFKEFPNCFKKKDGIKPLKVGIFKDVAERIEGSELVSKTQVRQALRKYTSNWRYLEAVTKTEFRIDLDGNDAEKVEQEHVEHAQKALEESRAKMAKRKKPQRPRQNDGETKSY